MAWRFRDSGDDGREWSVGDFVLGYRICTYNDEYKPGRVHVHDWTNDVVGALPEMSKPQAQRLVRQYASRYTWFTMDDLENIVKEFVK